MSKDNEIKWRSHSGEGPELRDIFGRFHRTTTGSKQSGCSDDNSIRIRITPDREGRGRTLYRLGLGAADGMRRAECKEVGINERLPGSGGTILHLAAALDARDMLRELIQEKDCDFLARDNQGRLASELAFIEGNDPAVARLLRIKERKQAESLGIRVTRRPQ
ncbi:MAG: ankyrin repeat domain-containing protein [Rhodospirillales bacterium]|nr:ankyrin repeat domain-containing protein [Rhodospirillales bacterium]